jgi:hypothetical protein
LLNAVTISRAACLVTALAVAALAVVGCSSNTTTATPATTTAAPPLWDACSLPANLLNAAGLNPTTKTHMDPYSGETTCEWTGAAYGVVVIADITLTLQQIHTKHGNHGFVDVTIAGRPGLQYYDNFDTQNKCALALPVKTGGVVAFLLLNNAPDVPGDPCVQVRGVAAALMPALPAG